MEDLISVGQLSIAFTIGFGFAVMLTFPALSKSAKETEDAEQELARARSEIEKLRRKLSGEQSREEAEAERLANIQSIRQQIYGDAPTEQGYPKQPPAKGG